MLGLVASDLLRVFLSALSSVGRLLSIHHVASEPREDSVAAHHAINERAVLLQSKARRGISKVPLSAK
jgi:hypothetical protein